MLPSLGISEMVLLGILALVVVGPKDLPLMLRKLGRWTAKLRAMAQEFRTGMDELARQAELDELRKEVDALRRTTSDIGRDVRREFNRMGEEPQNAPKPAAPTATPHDVTHAASQPAARIEPVTEASIPEPAPQAPTLEAPAPEPEKEPMARSVP